jgi:hypothetical protein
VFHRPARIAYEAQLGANMSQGARHSVSEEIMRVLAIENRGDSP